MPRQSGWPSPGWEAGKELTALAQPCLSEPPCLKLLETTALIRAGRGPCLAPRFAAREGTVVVGTGGFNRAQAMPLGCRAGSRQRKASITQERDETKSSLRCRLKHRGTGRELGRPGGRGYPGRVTARTPLAPSLPRPQTTRICRGVCKRGHPRLPTGSGIAGGWPRPRSPTSAGFYPAIVLIY